MLENVVLRGLSPAQNRSIPPLKYDVVHRLVKEWPDVKFVLNGGIHTFDEVESHLGWGDGNTEEYPVAGCMIGREAYRNPWLFADADRRFFNKRNPNITRREALEGYLDHCIDYANFVADQNSLRDAELLESCSRRKSSDSRQKLNVARKLQLALQMIVSMRTVIEVTSKGGHGSTGSIASGTWSSRSTTSSVAAPPARKRYKQRLDVLMNHFAAAKSARRAKTEHLWQVCGDDVEGEVRRCGEFVFDFSLLDKEDTGELLREMVTEAVKDTIPDTFLDAIPSQKRCKCAIETKEDIIIVLLLFSNV